jgi:O-antigen/teichoic acid export membrane protein
MTVRDTVVGATVNITGVRRARIGLTTNACSSIGNLGLTLTVAHRVGVATVGQYALAFSIYVLATSVVQAGITESVLSAPDLHQRGKAAQHEISLIGLVLSAIIIAAGIAVSSKYIIVTGFAIPGMLIYDYIKIVNMAALDARVSLRQEIAWTMLTFVGVALGLSGVVEVYVTYAIWALSGSAIGYLGAYRARLSIMPSWPGSRSDTRLTSLYAMDQVLGPGSLQLTTYLVAGLSGLTVVGALRAAGTFFSPLMLVIATSRSLVIPRLVPDEASEPRNEFRVAVRITVLQTALLLPAAVLIPLLPLSFCRILVGMSATAAKPLLVPLAVDAVLSVAATMAFSGHRAKRAGVRTVVLCLITCPLRVLLVVLGAQWWGASGAAWGTATSMFLGATIFWWSYHDLVFTGHAAKSQRAISPAGHR